MTELENALKLIGQYGFPTVLAVALLIVVLKDYTSRQRDELARLELMTKTTIGIADALKELRLFNEACHDRLETRLIGIEGDIKRLQGKAGI